MEERRKKIYGSLKDFAFILPSLAGVSVFVFFPFADVVKRSFTNISGETFVGLCNYKTVFENEAFHLAMRNIIGVFVFCRWQCLWFRWFLYGKCYFTGMGLSTVVLVWRQTG